MKTISEYFFQGKMKLRVLTMLFESPTVCTIDLFHHTSKRPEGKKEKGTRKKTKMKYNQIRIDATDRQTDKLTYLVSIDFGINE